MIASGVPILPYPAPQEHLLGEDALVIYFLLQK